MLKYEYKVEIFEEDGNLVHYTVGIPERSNIALVAAMMMDQTNAVTKQSKKLRTRSRIVMLVKTIYYLLMLRYNSRVGIWRSRKKRSLAMITSYISELREKRLRDKLKSLLKQK